MARRIPVGRFEELVHAATEEFIRQGYRRTQMADVAEAMGVAKGTLYLYVESKDALFDLALRCADSPHGIEIPAQLPLPTPAPEATVAFVRQRLAEHQQMPVLEAALAKRRVRDPAAEIESVIRELYGILARNRCGIKLLDRAAPDHPELASLWFDGGRDGLMVLFREYLTRRIACGQIRRFPDVAAAARMLIELVVFWAVHRHWDPHPQNIDDAVAQDTVVQFIVGALVGGGK